MKVLVGQFRAFSDLFHNAHIMAPIRIKTMGLNHFPIYSTTPMISVPLRCLLAQLQIILV